MNLSKSDRNWMLTILFQTLAVVFAHRIFGYQEREWWVVLTSALFCLALNYWLYHKNFSWYKPKQKEAGQLRTAGNEGKNQNQAS